MTQRLVLFAKPPLGGTAKTRLAADIGEAAASAVAEALLKDTLTLCEDVARNSGTDFEIRAPDRDTQDDPSAPTHLPPHRCVSPISVSVPEFRPDLVLAYTDDKDYFTELLPDRWKLLRQEGADLGKRLENALAAIGPAADDATVFVGMDAPHVPPEFLLRAFDALRESDTVLGPCDDGGYYLLGVKGRWPSGILGSIRWSTEHAYDDTRAAFENSGLSCAALPPWYDVDDVASLRRLADDFRRMPSDALPHMRETLTVLGGGSEVA